MDAHPPLPHYGLPPLPALPCPEMKGPTPWSNWVIKGRVLAGAYPASLDDDETDRILTTLLELGVNTFVCLQAEFALHTPETAWRSGQGLRPYIKDAQHVLIRARETRSTRIKQDKLDFLHLPIIDGSVTSDTALSRLADDCNLRILRGERLYIHCWGGHGRTGTLVATMLGRLYLLSCSNSLRYTQAFHDSRKFPQGVRSPQTQVQVAQVRRLLPDPPSMRGVVYPMSTVPLTDEILRPSSAPASPAGALALGTNMADLLDRSQLPINQQRKEAIRAKQALAATAAVQSEPPAMPVVTQEALAAALNRAFISRPQPEAAAGDVGGGGRADAPALRPHTSPEAAQRQPGYVQQFMQQRGMPQQQGGREAAAAAGLAGARAPASSPTAAAAAGMTTSAGGQASKLGTKLGRSGSPVFNLTASSGGGAFAQGEALQPLEDDEGALGDGVSGPLRPSKVTVTLPQSQPPLGKADPAAAAAPPAGGRRIGAVMGYLNAKLR